MLFAAAVVPDSRIVAELFIQAQASAFRRTSQVRGAKAGHHVPDLKSRELSAGSALVSSWTGRGGRELADAVEAADDGRSRKRAARRADMGPNRHRALQRAIALQPHDAPLITTWASPGAPPAIWIRPLWCTVVRPVAMKPGYPDAHYNLANVLLEQPQEARNISGLP